MLGGEHLPAVHTTHADVHAGTCFYATKSWREDVGYANLGGQGKGMRPPAAEQQGTRKTGNGDCFDDFLASGKMEALK